MKYNSGLIRLTCQYSFVSALHQSSLYIGKLLVQGAVNSLGVDAISAYTATGRIEDVILAFGNSGSEATSIFIAQNTGAKNQKRVLEGFKDALVLIQLVCIGLILFIFFYHKIFAITFDETFARATGVKAGLYNMLIAVLTAVTIVLGMRMMGALLISSLIIFPALTSMRVCRTFKSVILNSAVLSVVCLIAGLTISYVGATPAGASVVLANLAALIVYSCIGMIRNRAR